MRIITTVSVALLAACGGGKQVGRPVSGGTPIVRAGSAPESNAGGDARLVEEAAYCVASGQRLASFTADDKTATFCLRQESEVGELVGAPTCTAIDLATGAYSAGAAPTAPAAPAPAVMFRQDAKGVEMCKDGACKKLDLPKPKVEQGEVIPYELVASQDGKRVVAAGEALGGIAFLDGTTGKKVRSIKAEDEPQCIDGLYFVGESVYVARARCVADNGAAVLYSWAGKKLADFDVTEEINSARAIPVHAGGDRWAIRGLGGYDLLVFDAKTGKRVHHVTLASAEDCDRCGYVLGFDWSLEVSPVEKLPSGKLVALSGVGLSVVDPATGKLEQVHRMPICPETE
jgi:hypothetical protein